MPNYVHVLISFTETKQNINTIIGNGKRFMAYEIISRRKQDNETALLTLLAEKVETRRKEKNKQHDVWELSFDRKECRGREFINQKLDYIHANPCSGKWEFCKDSADYMYNPAKKSANFQF